VRELGCAKKPPSLENTNDEREEAKVARQARAPAREVDGPHPAHLARRAQRNDPQGLAVQTKRGAEQYEREIRLQLVSGQWKEAAKKVPTLAEFAEEFLKHQSTINELIKRLAPARSRPADGAARSQHKRSTRKRPTMKTPPHAGVDGKILLS
jgi:hypothetical protein